jgi:hypothetical protein
MDDPKDKQVGGTHYKDMAIQPVDVIEANFTKEEVIGYYRGNAVKYLLRAGNKTGNSFGQELAKAVHYCELLIAYRNKVENNEKG